MIHLQSLVLVGVLLLSPGAEDKGKAEDTWAKIVTGLLTPEHSKKGLEFQEKALVSPDVKLSFDAKMLGANLSLKAIQQKYGKAARVEEYRVRSDGKISTRQEYHYPPIYFVVEKGNDQVFLIAAPKKLWTGAGILENAKTALKGK